MQIIFFCRKMDLLSYALKSYRNLNIIMYLSLRCSRIKRTCHFSTSAFSPNQVSVLLSISPLSGCRDPRQPRGFRAGSKRGRDRLSHLVPVTARSRQLKLQEKRKAAFCRHVLTQFTPLRQQHPGFHILSLEVVGAGSDEGRRLHCRL